MQTCAPSKLAALITDRDLGPEAIACAEVPGGTEPPASPAQLPPKNRGPQEALCHMCQSHKDDFGTLDVTSYSNVGN